MDGLSCGVFGSGNDTRAGKVAFRSGRRPDAHRRVGLADVQCAGVGVGIDGDSA